MNSDYFDNWTRQSRKGFIELAILNLLKDGEQYGYDLVKKLVKLPGLQVAEGTVYPLLARLRLKGVVQTHLKPSKDGPDRKYYSLTHDGHESLKMMNTYAQSLINVCTTTGGKNNDKIQ